jgi:hypothetical protein
MVAITLIAGAAVFGWINGQAGSSENAVGQSVANNVNFLKERFVVVSQTFTGSGLRNSCSGGNSPNFQCKGADFWIYNNGQVGFTLYTIRVRNLTDIPSNAANHDPLNILFYSVCTVSSSACGFVAYDKAGVSAVCSNNGSSIFPSAPILNGFYQTMGGNYAMPAVLAQNTLSANPYQITMPTSSTCSAGAMFLYDGLTYTVTFAGLYGNSYQTTFTVSG